MIAAIIVLLFPVLSKAQYTISGTVAEKSNTFLPGATIKLKNKAAGTTADTQGKYTLSNLKAGNYTLVVSFIGYESIEKSIKLEADQVINFNLSTASFLADEVIVRATRASDKSATTYKNLSKADIEANNFGQDLPFILNNTPGVVVTSDAGAGVGYTGIRIRGSDASRINVTVNGIPYNDSESQGVFWVNMPDFASSVDNIQIQRGVGNSTNGAGAFGGSLNIQTASPADDAYAELNNTYGSFNTWKNTVKIGTGLIDNKWSFDGRLSSVRSDGFIDRASSNLKSYFLSGAYHGKTDLLRINIFSGAEKTYQAWNGVPESRLRGDVPGMLAYISRNLSKDPEGAANLLNSGNRTYNSFTYPDQTDNYWQTHYQAIYAKQFSDKLSFNGALHYTDGKGYFEEYKLRQQFIDYNLPDVNANGQLQTRTNLVRRRWLDNDFYGVTYAFNYKAKSNLNFTLGGAYNEYRGKHYGEIIWAQYASTSMLHDHYYDGRGNKNDFNVYGKVNYNPVEKLSLFADLQYRKVSYDISGTDKNLKILDFDNHYNFFNPKVGVTYLLDDQSNIYTSFGIANKEPNRDDFSNIKSGLVPRPERLNNIEAGYRFKNSRLSAGANVYGMFYKDQLIFTGEINEYADAYRQNVDKSYRMGIEFDASYILTSKFAVNANAAFSRNKIKNYIDYVSEYDDDSNVINVIKTPYANPDISFSPAAVVFGELVYKPFKGFAAAIQSKYVSKQYMDNTQNEGRKLNGYWVNNARFGYDFKLKGIKNINVGLLVNNLLDKKYESNGYTYSSVYKGDTTTENFYFPQAGTNFLLSLNLKF